MSRVFWDTNIFVYLYEDHVQFGSMVATMRERMLARGDKLYTSTLTVGELLAGPYARGDVGTAKRYKAALCPPTVEVLPFTEDTADQYARIRRDRGIAPADAIQLACAACAGIDLFITNDHRLRRKVISGIQFIAGLDADIL